MFPKLSRWGHEEGNIRYLTNTHKLVAISIWRDSPQEDGGPAPDPYNIQLVAPYPLQEHEGSSYIFFRDRDNDGYADTKGKGFYMFDLSRKIEEVDLPQKKYKMEDLQKDPWNVYEVSSLW